MLSNGKCSVAKFDHLGRSHQFPHPPMHDSKAVALAISLPNASGLPATDLIDDIARTLNRSQPVAHAVAEGMHHASVRHI